ncbi:MAG: nucleotidyltransferase family protein [Pseudomonadota bacterium]
MSCPDTSQGFDVALLAAGLSRRFGQDNKLLVDVGGEPMVRRVARQLRTLTHCQLIVVTGHEAEQVTDALGHLPDKVVHNPDYALGLSHSIAAAVSAVEPGRGALIAQGDMPDLSHEVLSALAAAFFESGCSAIVFPVTADGRQATPVIWPADLLPELAQLTGDGGAKAVIQRHLARCRPLVVNDALALRDIDTVAALDAWRQQTRPHED